MILTAEIISSLSEEEAINLIVSGTAEGIPGEIYANKDRAFRVNHCGVFEELKGQKCIACGWLITTTDMPEQFKGHPPNCPCCDKKMSLHVTCGHCGAENEVVWI